MKLIQAIEARHSVRAYKDQPIEAEKLQLLQRLVDECNTAGGLHIQLVKDDPKAFDTRMAHYGKFSGVKSYFALVGKNDSSLQEKVGYYGERLVLEAQRLGLNTCWVALTYKKNPDAFAVDEGEKLACVISVGYGVTAGVSHKIKSFDQVTHVEGEAPDWFKRGVAAALQAPTAINQQKFRFELLAGNRVKAKARLGFYSKIDLGIVKYHFEIGAGLENFEWA